MVEFRPVSKETVDVPSKSYHVVDPETGTVIGEMEAPLAFCHLDEGYCHAGHDFGFHNQQGYWIHNGCLQPTRKWWTETFRNERVNVRPGVVLPWES